LFLHCKTDTKGKKEILYWKYEINTFLLKFIKINTNTQKKYLNRYLTPILVCSIATYLKGRILKIFDKEAV